MVASTSPGCDRVALAVRRSSRARPGWSAARRRSPSPSPAAPAARPLRPRRPRASARRRRWLRRPTRPAPGRAPQLACDGTAPSRTSAMMRRCSAACASAQPSAGLARFGTADVAQRRARSPAVAGVDKRPGAHVARLLLQPDDLVARWRSARATSSSRRVETGTALRPARPPRSSRGARRCVSFAASAQTWPLHSTTRLHASSDAAAARRRRAPARSDRRPARSRARRPADGAASSWAS